MTINLRKASLLIGTIGILLLGRGTVLRINNEIGQHIYLINVSDTTISEAHISYNDEVLSRTNISPGSVLSQKIHASSDADFDISISFADGSKLEKNTLGYITSNDGSTSTFIINADRSLSFFQKY